MHSNCAVFIIPSQYHVVSLLQLKLKDQCLSCGIWYYDLSHAPLRVTQINMHVERRFQLAEC